MFRRRQFPTIGGKAPVEERGSASSQGYDAAWNKLSVAFRRRKPFCRFCEQDGFEARPADVVDHVVPIADGGARLKWENLQGLCHGHHNGLKRRLEDHARRTDQVHRLPDWCADKANRPDFSRRT